MNNDDKRKIAILVIAATATIGMAIFAGHYEHKSRQLAEKLDRLEKTTITFTNPDEEWHEFDQDDTVSGGAADIESGTASGAISID